MKFLRTDDNWLCDPIVNEALAAIKYNGDYADTNWWRDVVAAVCETIPITANAGQNIYSELAIHLKRRHFWNPDGEMGLW